MFRLRPAEDDVSSVAATESTIVPGAEEHESASSFAGMAAARRPSASPLAAASSPLLRRQPAGQLPSVATMLRQRPAGSELLQQPRRRPPPPDDDDDSDSDTDARVASWLERQDSAPPALGTYAVDDWAGAGRPTTRHSDIAQVRAVRHPPVCWALTLLRLL
jgi:hypothetical protein